MLSLAALAVLAPDERGFVEDIYLKYEKKLYAEALGITGNRHDAEDAVENAVLGVIGNISRFIGKSDREIASQLYIYTKYAAIDIYRKRARRMKKEILSDDDETTPEPPDDGPTIPELAVSAETAHVVREAVAGLSDEHRDVILLRMIHGYTSDEAAKILRVTPNAVNKRLARAKLKLRENLEEYMKDSDEINE